MRGGLIITVKDRSRVRENGLGDRSAISYRVYGIGCVSNESLTHPIFPVVA